MLIVDMEFNGRVLKVTRGSQTLGTNFGQVAGVKAWCERNHPGERVIIGSRLADLFNYGPNDPRRVLIEGGPAPELPQDAPRPFGR